MISGLEFRVQSIGLVRIIVSVLRILRVQGLRFRV